jgi:lipopolysaccharide transport system permease protein
MNMSYKKSISPNGLSQTVIRPQKGWRLIDLKELREYKDLFYFLVWRDIKVRYAQSVLGVGWAVIQPVFTMIIFTIVFGKLAKIGALTDASGSLIAGSGMLTKVYFPRIIIPMTPVLGKLVDFSIALLLLFGLMVWYKTMPTIWALTLPLLILLMILTATGLGMWLTALSIQYRDIKYGMSFAVRLLMYAAPVVYPASLIPDKYRLFYGLNPMAGVIEGFRSTLLGTRPMPWDLIIVGSITAIVIAISGAFYFSRMERIFADVA